MENINVLMIGDLVGATGRSIFTKLLPILKEKYSLDCIIVNGENSAHGKGITPAIADSFRAEGVDVITTGNHIWYRNEIIEYFSKSDRVLRPANYPPLCPGKGFVIFQYKEIYIAVINIMGRVFMSDNLDCPFRTMDHLLNEILPITKNIFVDFHAETTAEKLGMAFFLDGKVSALVGTHTHVQTADERILPGGTAYITDLGMGGSLNSMIGARIKQPLSKLIHQMPARHEVDDQPPFVLSGLYIKVNSRTGKAILLERVYEILHHIN